VATDGEIFRNSVREPQDFEEIFERHAASVWNYARRRVGSDAAEDVVADAFLIAFARRASFDPSYDSARPWLFGIATNVIRRRLRDERAYLTAMGRDFDPSTADPAEDVSGLDAQRIRPVLTAALMSLSSDDRETFMLVAVGELTYGETAAALGIPVGTVRSRMHRVRTLLRERIPELPAIDDGGE
jgi:RNA polymerase sigma factor (sigma-70 family)